MGDGWRVQFAGTGLPLTNQSLSYPAWGDKGSQLSTFWIWVSQELQVWSPGPSL